MVAEEEANDNFYISAARLTQIENEESIPSVFKLFTLCAVYGLDLHDVLANMASMPIALVTTGRGSSRRATRPASAGDLRIRR